MAIAAIIAAATKAAAAKAAAAATVTAATTAAAAPTVAASLPGIINTAGSMTGTGAGLTTTMAAPEALALQATTTGSGLPGIMGGQGAMAPVEGIMQGAQTAAPAAQTAGLDAAKQQLISANPASNLSYSMPDTMPSMAHPYGNFVSSAGTPSIDPASAYNQNIFSTPTMPPPPPVSSAIRGSEGILNNLLEGKSPEIKPHNFNAGSMKMGLEKGFETALSFAKENPMTTISGLQLLDRAFAPGQPKKRAFNPGYSLSPNFKPTLAPSAPSGVYGRSYADGGIIGQMPQQNMGGINSGYPMTQHTFPAYSGMPDGTGAGIEGYADTPQYAKGGVTRFMGGGYNGMQGQYGPTEEETTAAATPEYDINALYQKYLGRDADESGKKTYDPKKFTQQQLAGILQGSEEYKGQTLDPTEIQNAYKNVLQRDVDPTGAEGYLGQNYSPGAFEDALKQSKEYKEVVPFRTMERTVYRPEYEDYTKNPVTSVPGMAVPDKLSYAAIQEQLGHDPTLQEIGVASRAFEANKPTSADEYLAMAKKGEKGMATGGKTSETNLYRALSASGDEVTKADMDAITAYHQHAGQLAEDDDVDTRLLDPYSAAQVRLAKLSKKHKTEMAPVAKTNIDPANMAMGGITQNLGGYSDGGHLLKGPGDGMSDHIPATIGKNQPARLADGEFVIPADVVSHLGNGSTEAGAKQLYAMMSRIRKARTGNSKQGKQVNPRKLMPK